MWPHGPSVERSPLRARNDPGPAASDRPRRRSIDRCAAPCSRTGRSAGRRPCEHARSRKGASVGSVDSIACCFQRTSPAGPPGHTCRRRFRAASYPHGRRSQSASQPTRSLEPRIASCTEGPCHWHRRQLHADDEHAHSRHAGREPRRPPPRAAVPCFSAQQHRRSIPRRRPRHVRRLQASGRPRAGAVAHEGEHVVPRSPRE